MREWLSGRASPSQGERREFESRFPLHVAASLLVRRIFVQKYGFTLSAAAPFSQKGTLRSTAHLQACSRRFAVATTFLRVHHRCRGIFIVLFFHVGMDFVPFRFFISKKSVRRFVISICSCISPDCLPTQERKQGMRKKQNRPAFLQQGYEQTKNFLENFLIISVEYSIISLIAEKSFRSCEES